MADVLGDVHPTDVRLVHSAAQLEQEVIGWRVTPVTASPRFGTMRTWRGRRARYAEYNGGGLAFTRGQDSNGDELHPYRQVAFVKEGRITVARAGRTEVIEAGGMVAFRMDHYYEAIAERGTSIAMVLLPTDIIDSRGVDSRRVSGTNWEIGALDEEGRVDMPACRALVEAAGTMGITFHRAFDCVADRGAALEDVVALGCERILTSGGADDALQGATTIAADIARADGRLSLMAGAGLAAANIAEVARLAGVRELHASAKLFDPGRGGDGPAGLARGHWRSDAATVRALRAALDGM